MKNGETLADKYQKGGVKDCSKNMLGWLHEFARRSCAACCRWPCFGRGLD